MALTWTQDELAEALILHEAEFLERYPARSKQALRMKLERVTGQPYSEFRREQGDPAYVIQRRGDAPVVTGPDVAEAPTDQDLEQFFASLEATAEAWSDLRPGQKSTTITVEDDRPIGICAISDVHAGARGVRYDLFRRDLDLVANTPGLYVIFNGDLIEAVMPQAKNGTALFSGLFNNPDEQAAYILLRLKREEVRSKILAICEGNHDHAITRWAGVEKLSGIARALGVPYFTEAGGKIVVEIGSQRYVIYARHQHPGVSQISPSNSSRRAWQEFPDFENADVVVLSHLHFPDTHVTPRKGRDVIWFRSGTYKTMDSWAESKGYTPSYGVPMVILHPGERKLIPFHGTLFPEAVAYLRRLRGE